MKEVFCPLIKATCVGEDCICYSSKEREGTTKTLYIPWCNYFDSHAIGENVWVNNETGEYE